MKQILTIALVALLALPMVSCLKKSKGELKTEGERLGYVLGLDTGSSLKRLETDIDLRAFKSGVKDSYKGEEQRLTSKEAAEVMTAFRKKMQEKGMVKQKEVGEVNLREGEAFLAENKKKEDVKTTESGLQYRVIKKGKGPRPKATDKVRVHYKGTLINGEEFDSSIKRGEPAVFPANQVIPGWTEALQIMNVGSKYELFIPSQLAYGERGAGQMIGPNATLLFEVELLGIEK